MTSIYLCAGDGGKFAVPRWVAVQSRTVEKMLEHLPENFTQLHFPEITSGGLENVRFGFDCSVVTLARPTEDGFDTNVTVDVWYILLAGYPIPFLQIKVPVRVEKTVSFGLNSCLSKVGSLGSSDLF